MNILFVCENYAPHIGGAEIVFKTLAEELVQRGTHVDIVTRRLKKTPAYEILNGVHIHRVRSFDSRYFFTFCSVPRVLTLARKADVIHTTTFNGAPPAWLASRILRKKCILTVHEVWVNRWREITDCSWLSAFVHNILEKMIYALPFDHYACVSKHTRSALTHIGIPENKSSVVYNGVQYDVFHADVTASEPFSSFVYLCYGRPGPSKGIEAAVQAFAKITDIVNTRLLLMLSKDSAYKKRYASIQRLVQQLGIQDKVVFREPLAWNMLPGFLKSVNCVVIPSFAECFCFAAAETAALNVPIVATTAGSLPEVVSGNVISVVPKNSDALAQGMIDAFHGKYKLIPVKKFTIKENVDKYVALYNELVKS